MTADQLFEQNNLHADVCESIRVYDACCLSMSSDSLDETVANDSHKVK